tara:strand:+ start:59 stop:865 length:807 start_codon:yes stop_codon:yes gene_type:complete
MYKFRYVISATLFALAVSSGASATDAESLSNRETKGPQLSSQCREDLRAFDQKLAEVGFGVLPPGGYGISSSSSYSGYAAYGTGGTARRKIYSLRDAAYVYAMDGDEKSCQLVLASMLKTYEGHQKSVGLEADNPDLRIAWRRVHLERAQPVTKMARLMRADIVIGAEIRTPNDDKVGEIEDIVLDPAQQRIAYVLASRGGFLGIGGKLVAVRWKDLRFTEDHKLYVLDIAKSAFENAPTVDRRNFDKTAETGWRQELDRFWDRNLKR